jgi:hypothetical protein
MDEEGYWTFSESVGLSAPEEHRADWFNVQIRAAIMQALSHGRSGRADDDPVAP